MNRSLQEILLLAIVILAGFIHTSCNETFVNQAPFELVQDTVFLDANNWYHFSPTPSIKDNAPMFPFSYNIFEGGGSGFLLKGSTKIYYLEFGKTLQSAHVFLDPQAEVGDTLVKFSDRHYHLLLDKKYDDAIEDDIFYVLRRSKKGVGTLEERAVWVMSQKQGLLAVSNYEIDYRTGVVTLDIVGEPNYFRESSFIPRIKFYDFDRAYHVDRERNIIYTFEKHKGRLKSKNFEKGVELYEYTFKSGQMSKLVNFRIETSQNTIRLVAEDSCFLFNEMLELQYSRPCD